MKLDDSLGWIDFEIGDSKRRVDLYMANDAFVEAGKDVTEDTPPPEVFQRIIAAGKVLGLDDLNVRTLTQIRSTVFARMEELRKKDLAPQNAG